MASLAAVGELRGATDGRGVITALAGLSKGCAACVGVTALAGAGIGQAPRHAPVPLLGDPKPASLHAGEWSWLTAVARTEEPYNDEMQLTAPARMERCS
jgi:hypothetical protein